MKQRMLFLLFLGFLLCLPASAQSASLSGKVTAGAEKAPLVNAALTLKGAGREQHATSAADGSYQFSALQTAEYVLEVSAPGLNSVTRSGIRLTGDNAQVDVNLQLADVRKSVIVNSDVVSLEAASTVISQTINSTEVKELPNVTRSPTKYATLDPHVLMVEGAGADFTGSYRLSINGASYRHTSFMLDGTTNYDWIYANNPQAIVAVASVDNIEVLTGNYSAQYGNSTSGIVVINTASGTDVHHGELFSYLRPSGIQGTPALGTRHVPNQKLDWGALAGGPLLKNRTNYFASYERVMQTRGAFITSPTPAVFTGQSNEYAGLLKLDHNLSAKHSVTMRLNGNHYASDNTDDRVSDINNPTYGRTQRLQSWGGQVSDQAVIGNKVNVARFAYTRYTPDNAAPITPSVGISVQSYLQAGNSTYSWVHAHSETASDLFTFRLGRHDFKIGGEFEHLHARDYSYTAAGTYYYDNKANYLINKPTKYTQTYGTADVRYGQKELSAFIQDDVRISPRLTANLGLRYEFQSITDSLHNFGPRVGLAWRATGDGKTTVRVGGGMYFDQYYLYLNRRFITLGPNSPQYNYTWDCNVACPTYPNIMASPGAGKTTPTVSYLYIPNKQLLNPYSIQISAAVERELWHGTTLTLSGLNIHTAHQMRVNDINHPAPFTPTTLKPIRTIAEANAARPFSSYAGLDNVTLVDRIDNTSSSTFQSFDVALQSHMGRWGEFQAHYMLSASYAYTMFYADYNSGVPSEWYPNWDRYERGPSDFYQRNHFIADAVLHGPQKLNLALVGNFGSGLPVNPIVGTDVNGDGYTVDRPQGMGRNSYRGPSQKTIDSALSRKFALSHNTAFEARFEALNVLNSKNFIVLNGTYGNPMLSAPTPGPSFLARKAGVQNTNPSRQLQFVARIHF